MTRIEIIILKRLFASSKRKLSAYTIYQRSQFSTVDFNKSIFSLEEKKLITIDDLLIISLSEEGLNWLLSKDNKKISVNKEWLEIPEKFKTKYIIENDSYYIPNLTLLKDNI